MKIHNKLLYAIATLTPFLLLLSQESSAVELKTITHTFPIVVNTSSVWNNNEIPVCWENPDRSNLVERGWVSDAILNSWEKESAVTFTGWGKCVKKGNPVHRLGRNLGIRILIEDSQPMVKSLGNNLDGVENGMILNFTFSKWNSASSCQTSPEDCIRSIAIHEFGHALGIAHEQNRSDTPSGFSCSRQGSNGDWLVTPYDLHSVMNYCNPNWNGDGALSASDIHGVVKLYGSNPDNILGFNEKGDKFTQAMATGDFNQDGIDDLAIGAPGEAPGSYPESGAVFIYIGTETGGLRPWQSLLQSDVKPDGSRLGANEKDDRFGYSLASGDFDNDGFDDLAIGTPGEAPGNDPKSGIVFLFKGGEDKLTAWTSIEQQNLMANGYALGYNEEDDRFGTALSVGDYNHDFIDDLAVGAPGETPGEGPKSGSVYLFIGSRGSGLVAFDALTQEYLDQNTRGDRFGSSLATGDFDGDRVDDLAVGAPNKDYVGAVFTFKGSNAGLEPWERLKTFGVKNKQYGYSLASGDFNGDFRDDLAVGAPLSWQNNSAQTVTGLVNLYYGSSRYNGLLPWKILDQSGLGENERLDNFGWSLAAADLNHDRVDDLAVGTPGEAPGSDPKSGYVFLFSGERGVGVSAWKGIDQTWLDINENNDFFGGALTIGHFSGTTNNQLVVGAPYKEFESGRAFVYGVRPILQNSTIANDPMRPWYEFGQSY